jgi:hypothetical protein
MSIPKSKVLTVSKGFNANLKYQSGVAKQEQNVTVNIGAPVERSIEQTDVIYSENPYSNLKLPDSVEEFRAIIQEKDRLNEALNLILHIIENNPLIVNKLIIATNEMLSNLIQLLTNSDSVDITMKHSDIGCCGATADVQLVDKIFVKRGNEVLNLKYTYPDVIQLLDSHNISYKMTIN